MVWKGLKLTNKQNALTRLNEVPSCQERVKFDPLKKGVSDER